MPFNDSQSETPNDKDMGSLAGDNYIDKLRGEEQTPNKIERDGKQSGHEKSRQSIQTGWPTGKINLETDKSAHFYSPRRF